MSFSSSLKNFFQHSLNGNLMTTNFFNLCLSENIFIFPSLLKGNFVVYRILEGWIFLSQYFNYCTPLSVLSFMISEKSDLIFIFILQ